LTTTKLRKVQNQFKTLVEQSQNKVSSSEYHSYYVHIKFSSY